MSVFIGSQRKQGEKVELKVHEVSRIIVGKVNRVGGGYAQELFIVSHDGSTVMIDLFTDNENALKIEKSKRGFSFGSLQVAAGK